ncbi:hypothetical protein P9112_013308 [Eukaryota sp. TZLM1-RC]
MLQFRRTAPSGHPSSLGVVQVSTPSLSPTKSQRLKSPNKTNRNLYARHMTFGASKLFAAFQDSRIRVFDPHTASLLDTISLGKAIPTAMTSIQSLPHETIWVGTNQTNLLVYNAGDFDLLFQPSITTGSTFAISELPQGVIVVTSEGHVKLYDKHCCQLLSTLSATIHSPKGITGFGRCVYFCFNNNICGFYLDDSYFDFIKFFNEIVQDSCPHTLAFATWRQVITTSDDVSTPRGCPSGLLFAGLENGLIRCFNAITGELLTTLKGHFAAISCIKVDGMMMLSGDLEGNLIVWDLSTLKFLRGDQEGINVIESEIIKKHEGRITDICFIEDLIWVSSTDQTLSTWSSDQLSVGKGQNVAQNSENYFDFYVHSFLNDGSTEPNTPISKTPYPEVIVDSPLFATEFYTPPVNERNIDTSPRVCDGDGVISRDRDDTSPRVCDGDVAKYKRLLKQKLAIIKSLETELTQTRNTLSRFEQINHPESPNRNNQTLKSFLIDCLGLAPSASIIDIMDSISDLNSRYKESIPSEVLASKARDLLGVSSIDAILEALERTVYESSLLSSTNTELEARVRVYQSQNNSLESALEVTKARLVESNSKFLDVNDEFEALKEDHDEIKRAYDELSRNFEDVVKENEELKGRVGENLDDFTKYKDVLAESANLVQSLSNEIDCLKNENATLLHEAQVFKNSIADYKSVINNYEETIQSATCELSTLNQTTCRVSRDQVTSGDQVKSGDHLNEVILNLKENIVKSCAESSGLKELTSTLQAKLNEQDLVIEQLNQEVSNSAQQNIEISNDLSREKEISAQLREYVGELEGLKHELESNISTVRDELTVELTECSEKLVVAQEILDDNETQINHLHTELNLKNTLISKLEKDRDSVKKNLEDLQQQYDLLKEHLGGEIDDLKDELQGVLELTTDLESDNFKLESKCNYFSSRIDDLIKEKDFVFINNIKLSSDKEQLIAEFIREKSSFVLEIEGLKSSNSHLQDQLTTKNSLINSLEQQVNSLENFKGEVNEIFFENLDGKTDVDLENSNPTVKISSLFSKNSQLFTELNEVKSELGTYIDDFGQLQLENSELININQIQSAENQELLSKITELKSNLTENSSKLEVISIENAEFCQKINELQDQLTTKNSLINSLEQQVNSLENFKGEVNEIFFENLDGKTDVDLENSNPTVKISSLFSKNSQLFTELNEVKSELGTYIDDFGQLQLENSKLININQIQSAENQELLSKISELKSNLTENSSKLEVISIENAEFCQKINELQDQLTTKNSLINSLEQQVNSLENFKGEVNEIFVENLDGKTDVDLENSNPTVKISSLFSKNSQLFTELNEVKSELGTYIDDFGQLQLENSELININQIQSAENQELLSKITELKSNLTENSSKLEVISIENAEFCQKINELQDQLTTKNSLINSLEQQVNSLENFKGEVNEIFVENLDGKTDVGLENSNPTVKISSLFSKNSQLFTELNEVKSELGTYIDDFGQLQLENSKLININQIQSAENQELLSKISELKSNLTENSSKLEVISIENAEFCQKNQ